MRLQIYVDIEYGPETREFTSVLTARDMYDQMKMQGKPLVYYRIPITDDHAPDEEVNLPSKQTNTTRSLRCNAIRIAIARSITANQQINIGSMSD